MTAQALDAVRAVLQDGHPNGAALRTTAYESMVDGIGGNDTGEPERPRTPGRTRRRDASSVYLPGLEDDDEAYLDDDDDEADGSGASFGDSSSDACCRPSPRSLAVDDPRVSSRS